MKIIIEPGVTNIIVLQNFIRYCKLNSGKCTYSKILELSGAYYNDFQKL